jgi:mycothiol synthase
LTGATGIVEIRRATGPADLETYVRLVNEVSPDEPTSLSYVAWQDATYPGGVRFLATLDGEPVGQASVGRIYMYPPEFDAFWATIGVVPKARRRGIGTLLLDAVREVAREHGKGWLHVPATDERPEGEAFLAAHGFTELDRHKIVRLDLAGLPAPEVDPPGGVTLTTLAERPELVEGVHAVAVAAFPDIPSAAEPMAVGDLAEFRARDVDELPGWGFAVAIDDATGEVVGYASLYERVDGAGVYWHDMTAVLPAWRGRGLATALKLATIRAAIEHGAVALETGNDVENAPMRAVNARLGYRPMPDSTSMRGPAAPVIMGR